MYHSDQKQTFLWLECISLCTQQHKTEIVTNKDRQIKISNVILFWSLSQKYLVYLFTVHQICFFYK